MRRNMDAFIAAVDEAKRRYTRHTGEALSDRRLIELAGYPPAERAGVSYHLNRRKKWVKGHKVPPEIVARFAAALEGYTSHKELMEAAHMAAGYTVKVAGADLPTAYARFLGSSEVSNDEKQEVTARLLQIIADETARKGQPVR